MPRKRGKKCRCRLLVRGKKNPKGMVIVYTGQGKGKTTAALGLMLRAISRFSPILFVQFLKGSWESGELSVFRKYDLPIEAHSFGAGFTWSVKPSENAKAMQRAFTFALKKLKSGKYPLVVFDEINCAMDYGFIPVSKVLKAVRAKPPHVHLVLTGRNAPAKLVQIADLVTDMKEVKHPFRNQGVLARAGIDF